MTDTGMAAPDPDPKLADTIYGAYKNGHPGIIDDLRQQRIDVIEDPAREALALQKFDALVAQVFAKWQADNEMPEAQRVKQAAKNAKAANAAAPSSEDVQKLTQPIVVTPTLGNDGSTVESIKISRWEVDPETNTPVLIEEDVEPT